MARKSWKKKGGAHFQPPLFFFSLPGGKSGKITTATPSTGHTKYSRRSVGRRTSGSYSPEVPTGRAVRMRQQDRLRRII